jgi:hypothetical protein
MWPGLPADDLDNQDLQAWHAACKQLAHLVRVERVPERDAIDSVLVEIANLVKHADR